MQTTKNKIISCPDCGSENLVKRGKAHRYLNTIPKEVWPATLQKCDVPPKRVPIQQYQCNDCWRIFVTQGEDTVIVVEEL